MPKVGILGLGFMGKMHFGVHKSLKQSRLVAIADTDPKKLAGDWSAIGGNISDPSAPRVDLTGIRTHKSLDDLLADREVEVVDICLPTFLHKDATIAALKAGKHVLCEKPMALDSRECKAVLAAAGKAKGKLMIAHCIRFWPEYEVITETVKSGRLGRIWSVVATRRGGTPTWSWGNWLLQSEKSGAAVLDLHIHDADFVISLFGAPRAVVARGAVGVSGGVDHIQALYEYEDVPLVSLDGGWLGQPGYPFGMTLQIFAEKGTVVLDSSAKPALRVYTPDGKMTVPEVPPGDGYTREIAYFLGCVDEDRPVDRVTPASAALSVRAVEAELESVRTGKRVVFGRGKD